MSIAPGPQRITTEGPARLLHDAAATRRAESLAQAQHPPGALMNCAGLAVARLAMAMTPHARVVHVFAGPGNNGGDGLVAARHLHLAGKQVRVTVMADPGGLPPDAALAWTHALAAGVPAGTWRDSLHAARSGCDLVIDALLGLGAARAVTGALSDAIAAINHSGAPVLAVDLPSGLHPDTGAALGGPVVRAQSTLSLLTLKPGCFTAEGRDHVGQVWLDTLGVVAGEGTAWLTGCICENTRLHSSHKGSQGDVAVVGGAPGMVGAAWLAGRAALAAGAGRVYLSLIDDQATHPDTLWPELMHRPKWWHSPPDVLGQTTVVCGCGAGDALAGILPVLLSHAARLVLDADALNAVAAEPDLLIALRRRGARGHRTVLTPHPLEAARLLGCSTAQVQHDRLAAAQQLAGHTGATVVLKGSGSVVAHVGALPFINPTGNAALATAGTGDVLAGWIGGVWAQTPTRPPQALSARAAWQHGHAADRFVRQGGRGPLRAADLVEWMARPSLQAG